MSLELNDKDFKTILEFYNKKIPTSSKDMREEAEKIITPKAKPDTEGTTNDENNETVDTSTSTN